MKYVCIDILFKSFFFCLFLKEKWDLKYVNIQYHVDGNLEKKTL